MFCEKCGLMNLPSLTNAPAKDTGIDAEIPLTPIYFSRALKSHFLPCASRISEHEIESPSRVAAEGIICLRDGFGTVTSQATSLAEN